MHTDVWDKETHDILSSLQIRDVVGVFCVMDLQHLCATNCAYADPVCIDVHSAHHMRCVCTIEPTHATVPIFPIFHKRQTRASRHNFQPQRYPVFSRFAIFLHTKVVGSLVSYIHTPTGKHTYTEQVCSKTGLIDNL